MLLCRLALLELAPLADGLFHRCGWIRSQLFHQGYQFGIQLNGNSLLRGVGRGWHYKSSNRATLHLTIAEKLSFSSCNDLMAIASAFIPPELKLDRKIRIKKYVNL
jgi:hypothetical protein